MNDSQGSRASEPAPARFESRTTSLIDPVYWQSAPNETIELSRFEARLASDPDETHPATARITFFPRLNLIFELDSPDPSKWHWTNLFKGRDADQLTITGLETTHEVFPLSTDGRYGRYASRRVPIQTRTASQSIARATFHLLNWPHFLGPERYVLETRTSTTTRRCQCSTFRLSFGGWIVTVATIHGTQEIVEALSESGGYAITHVGTIERGDASSFSTSDLESVTFFLAYFFTFSLGRWSSPSLTVGYDSSGEIVFEHWGIGNVAAGRWPPWKSCFDSHHAEFLPEVVNGFWGLWNDPVWQKPLREAVYWYAMANTAGGGELGVDAAMLFSQSALELLAWNHCVLVRKMVSRNAFNQRGLSAADKLRLLVSSLGIPMEIPVAMTSLHSKKGAKWEDSLHAITDIRNKIVHPDQDRNIPENGFYDGWRLSMWYLDLVFLALCRYEGNYGNRIAARYCGTVERVPWAT